MIHVVLSLTILSRCALELKDLKQILTTALVFWCELFYSNLINGTLNCEMTPHGASSTMRWLCNFLSARPRALLALRDWYLMTALCDSSVIACRTSHWQSPSVFPVNPWKSENTSLFFFWLPTGDTTPTLWLSVNRTGKSNRSASWKLGVKQVWTFLCMEKVGWLW